MEFINCFLFFWFLDPEHWFYLVLIRIRVQGAKSKQILADTDQASSSHWQFEFLIICFLVLN